MVRALGRAIPQNDHFDPYYDQLSEGSIDVDPSSVASLGKDAQTLEDAIKNELIPPNQAALLFSINPNIRLDSLLSPKEITILRKKLRCYVEGTLSSDDESLGTMLERMDDSSRYHEEDDKSEARNDEERKSRSQPPCSPNSQRDNAYKASRASFTRHPTSSPVGKTRNETLKRPALKKTKKFGAAKFQEEMLKKYFIRGSPSLARETPRKEAAKALPLCLSKESSQKVIASDSPSAKYVSGSSSSSDLGRPEHGTKQLIRSQKEAFGVLDANPAQYEKALDFYKRALGQSVNSVAAIPIRNTVRSPRSRPGSPEKHRSTRSSIDNQEAPKIEHPKKDLSPRGSFNKQEAPNEVLRDNQLFPRGSIDNQEDPTEDLQDNQHARRGSFNKQEAPNEDFRDNQLSPRGNLHKQEAPKEELPKEEPSSSMSEKSAVSAMSNSSKLSKQKVRSPRSAWRVIMGRKENPSPAEATEGAAVGPAGNEKKDMSEETLGTAENPRAAENENGSRSQCSESGYENKGRDKKSQDKKPLDERDESLLQGRDRTKKTDNRGLSLLQLASRNQTGFSQMGVPSFSRVPSSIKLGKISSSTSGIVQQESEFSVTLAESTVSSLVAEKIKRPSKNKEQHLKHQNSSTPKTPSSGSGLGKHVAREDKGQADKTGGEGTGKKENNFAKNEESSSKKENVNEADEWARIMLLSFTRSNPSESSNNSNSHENSTNRGSSSDYVTTDDEASGEGLATDSNGTGKGDYYSSEDVTSSENVSSASPDKEEENEVGKGIFSEIIAALSALPPVSPPNRPETAEKQRSTRSSIGNQEDPNEDLQDNQHARRGSFHKQEAPNEDFPDNNQLSPRGSFHKQEAPKEELPKEGSLSPKSEKSAMLAKSNSSKFSNNQKGRSPRSAWRVILGRRKNPLPTEATEGAAVGSAGKETKEMSEEPLGAAENSKAAENENGSRSQCSESGYENKERDKKPLDERDDALLQGGNRAKETDYGGSSSLLQLASRNQTGFSQMGLPSSSSVPGSIKVGKVSGIVPLESELSETLAESTVSSLVTENIKRASKKYKEQQPLKHQISSSTKTSSSGSELGKHGARDDKGQADKTGGEGREKKANNSAKKNKESSSKKEKAKEADEWARIMLLSFTRSNPFESSSNSNSSESESSGDGSSTNRGNSSSYYDTTTTDEETSGEELVTDSSGTAGKGGNCDSGTTGKGGDYYDSSEDFTSDENVSSSSASTDDNKQEKENEQPKRGMFSEVVAALSSLSTSMFQSGHEDEVEVELKVVQSSSERDSALPPKATESVTSSATIATRSTTKGTTLTTPQVAAVDWVAPVDSVPPPITTGTTTTTVASTSPTTCTTADNNAPTKSRGTTRRKWFF